MTSSFSLNPVAVEAAAKAMDGGIAFEDHVAPIKRGKLKSAEAAIRAFLAAEGASHLHHGKAVRIVTEWREL